MNVISLVNECGIPERKRPQSVGKIGPFITQFWDKWDGLPSFFPNSQERDLGYTHNDISFLTAQVVINTNQKLFFNLLSSLKEYCAIKPLLSWDPLPKYLLKKTSTTWEPDDDNK